MASLLGQLDHWRPQSTGELNNALVTDLSPFVSSISGLVSVNFYQRTCISELISVNEVPIDELAVVEGAQMVPTGRNWPMTANQCQASGQFLCLLHLRDTIIIAMVAISTIIAIMTTLATTTTTVLSNKIDVDVASSWRRKMTVVCALANKNNMLT